MPSRPEEFRLEPLTDPDLILSHHPARVIARRLPPSAETSGSSRFDPVGPTQRRLPTPFAPRELPRFIATTEQSAPLRRIGTFSLAVVAACAFFPWHHRPGSHVPYRSQIELRAAYMPDAAWAVSVHPPSLSRKMGQPPVLTSSNRFSTLQKRFACARLSQSCLPDSLVRLFRNVHHRGF